MTGTVFFDDPCSQSEEIRNCVHCLRYMYTVVIVGCKQMVHCMLGFIGELVGYIKEEVVNVRQFQVNTRGLFTSLDRGASHILSSLLANPPL